MGYYNFRQNNLINKRTINDCFFTCHLHFHSWCKDDVTLSETSANKNWQPLKYIFLLFIVTKTRYLTKNLSFKSFQSKYSPRDLRHQDKILKCTVSISELEDVETNLSISSMQQKDAMRKKGSQIPYKSFYYDPPFIKNGHYSTVWSYLNQFNLWTCSPGSLTCSWLCWREALHLQASVRSTCCPVWIPGKFKCWSTAVRGSSWPETLRRGAFYPPVLIPQHLASRSASDRMRDVLQ